MSDSKLIENVDYKIEKFQNGFHVIHLTDKSAKVFAEFSDKLEAQFFPKGDNALVQTTIK